MLHSPREHASSVAGLRRHVITLLAVLVLTSLPCLADAQGYWVYYPNSCPSVCGSAGPGYESCVSDCNYCLLHWSCSYTCFLPYFTRSGGGTVYFLGQNSCSCYWPWWAWTLLAIGLCTLLCCCIPIIAIYCCCKGLLNLGRRSGETTVVVSNATNEENYVPGTAPRPDVYTAAPAGGVGGYPMVVPQGQGYPAPPPAAYPTAAPAKAFDQ